MEFSVWTNNQAIVLSFDIEMNGNEIIAFGYDPEYENTEYFERSILESGNFEFNLPKSPKLLKVSVFGLTNNNKFIVKNVKLGKLKKNVLLIDANTKEFIDFAQQFSIMAGYSKPGNYYSKNRKFQIQYTQNIEENDTPSRIHKYTGIIDVSKNWFDGMTIPGRLAILIHEFAHNHLDSEEQLIDIDKLTEKEYKEYINKIEKQADGNALQIYIGLGYPKIEWMYAWAHIFKDTDSHVDRLINSDDMLRIM
jgi:hypothetical protein